MKSRSTIVLAAILTALSVGYWLTLEHEQHQHAVVEQAKRVFSFEADAVSSVTIHRQGEQATTGARDGKSWKITAPYPVRPNDQVWERVAKALAGLSRERVIGDAGENLAEYGLKDPVLTVNARTAKGEDVQVLLGAQDPTQKFRYAQSGNSPVFLVSPDTFFDLDRTLQALRDRNMIENSSSGITHIEYARIRPPQDAAATPPADANAAKTDTSGTMTWEESVSVIVERDGTGPWRITSPVQGPADQEMVEPLANELQFEVGRDYIDTPENLTDYGLAPPKARVTVRCGADGTPQTIYFGMFVGKGADKGGMYVKKEGSPSVCVVDSHIVTLFPNKVDAYREKRLLARKAADIRHLVYTEGPHTFNLDNPENKAWTLVEGRAGETDQSSVSRFIGNLISARGTDYFSERKPEFGLGAPAIRIAITFAGSDKPVEILVGAKTADGSGYYVTQDSGAVTILPSDQVDTLRANVGDFISKGLLSFSKDQATQILMNFDGAGYVFQKGQDTWFVREPSNKAWESQSDMTALLDAFGACNAEAIEAPVAPTDRTAYGLVHPILTVRAAITAKAKEGTVMVGPLEIGDLCKDNAHQRYATVAGRSELFRVNEAIVESVRESLRGLKIIPPPDTIPRKPEVKVDQ